MATRYNNGSFNDFWELMERTLKVETPALLSDIFSANKDPYLVNSYYCILKSVLSASNLLFYFKNGSKVYGCPSKGLNLDFKPGAVRLKEHPSSLMPMRYTYSIKYYD